MDNNPIDSRTYEYLYDIANKIIDDYCNYIKYDSNYVNDVYKRLEIYYYKITEKRHAYLLSLVEKIQKTQDINEKRSMIQEIYHNSESVLEKKWGVLKYIPDYGVTTYKEYWDKVRKKLEKEVYNL